MSIRVGTSWRGRRPGTRHWVSGPLWLMVFFWLPGLALEILIYGLLWSVVLMVWLGAETAVLLWSAIYIAAQLIDRQHLDWARADFHQLPAFWLWEFTIPRREDP